MGHGSNIRRIGWIAVLVICTALYLMLHLRVNATKSEVALAERKIVSLEQQKFLLETEFQTRANQQQLFAWNEVDFGYKAPDAGQFLDNERELAAFGAPRAAGAPEPIRVASAPRAEEDSAPFPLMVSPLTGTAVAAELPDEGSHKHRASLMADKRSSAEIGESLSARLSRGALRVALDADLGSNK